mgnify:CR=1 FL=1
MRGYGAIKESFSTSAGLLVSILVRYPELGTINYDPEQHCLRFTFLLTRVLTEEEFGAWREKLEASLEAYWYLEKREPVAFDVQWSTFGRVAVLEITRDVGTLTQEEISLVIDLLREGFGALLMVDGDDTVIEEELRQQEELIGQMLEDFKVTRLERKLIAFREEGRVLVFNQ